MPLPQEVPNRVCYRFADLDLARTALLVIDMQEAFIALGRVCATGARAIVGNINALMKAVRRYGTIVLTRHTMTAHGEYALPRWQADMPRVRTMAPLFEAGTKPHAIDPRIDVAPADVVIDKYRFSALTRNSSTLPEVLEARSVNNVIVTGVAANCCCESTARDASQLGFKTFFVSDSVAAVTAGEHEAALLNMGMMFADVRSTREMLELVAKASSAEKGATPPSDDGPQQRMQHD